MPEKPEKEFDLPNKRPSIFKEFLIFLKEEKIWWITPIVLVLLLLSLFIFLTEGSAVLPFIYAVF